jgi:hypothetical protein
MVDKREARELLNGFLGEYNIVSRHLKMLEIDFKSEDREIQNLWGLCLSCITSEDYGECKTNLEKIREIYVGLKTKYPRLKTDKYFPTPEKRLNGLIAYLS